MWLPLDPTTEPPWSRMPRFADLLDCACEGMVGGFSLRSLICGRKIASRRRGQTALAGGVTSDGHRCILRAGRAGITTSTGNRCRVGKGRPAGSIELRVSPSPSKIPYGGFSPVRLQMDRQWRPSTTPQGLSAVHIRPVTPSYTPPQLQLPGVRDPRRDYPF